MTPRTLRYLFATAFIGVLGLVCCTQADARSPFWRPRPAPPPYTFSLEDEQGNSLPTFPKDGRTFLLGEPGLRYNIRACNPTPERVEAVISVDGRDAISGRPGDYVNERGYVVPAYGCTLIEGFRRSSEEVAAFRFTNPEDSYSSRMGSPQNVGVIGVAFFPERARPPAPVVCRRVPRPARLPYDSYRDQESDRRAPAQSQPLKRSAPVPTAPGAASDGRANPAARSRSEAGGSASDDLGGSGSVNNLGTQFGETRDSAVSSVSFERASATHPALLLTLRYDDADGLLSRGIDLSAYGYGRYGRRIDDEPQAFPVSRFAQPPP